MLYSFPLPGFTLLCSCSSATYLSQFSRLLCLQSHGDDLGEINPSPPIMSRGHISSFLIRAIDSLTILCQDAMEIQLQWKFSGFLPTRSPPPNLSYAEILKSSCLIACPLFKTSHFLSDLPIICPSDFLSLGFHPTINNHAYLSFLDSTQLSSPQRRLLGLCRQIQSFSQHFILGGMSLQYVLPKGGYGSVLLAPSTSTYLVNTQ